MNPIKSVFFIFVGILFMFMCIFMLIAPFVAANWLNTSLSMTWLDGHNIKTLAIVMGVVSVILIIPGARPYG